MHAGTILERTVMCKRITVVASILVFVSTVGVRADLEGYWKFDEGSGSMVSDSSGNGRVGTILGATWHTTGWDGNGRSLNFDGTNDLVELGAFDVVGPGITLAAWIRPDDFTRHGSRIISKANEYNIEDHWWMLGPYPLPGGKRLRFRLKTTDGLPTTDLIASSGTVAAGKWQHAAATWDGTMMRVYLDGVQTGSVAKGGAAVAVDATVTVAVGSQPSDAFDTDPSHVLERFFDGLIDEVQVYNEALSSTEVVDLFNGLLPIAGPPNDECVDAEAVGEVNLLPFDTTEATVDGPGLCLISPNIWYCYTAPCTGEATVSLLGSGYDTMLAVYDGCKCYPAAGDLIACNDDFESSRQSQITFDAAAGNRYLIEVGGYSSNTGQGVLSITCESVQSPTKDDCANAQAVGDVKDLPFDTRNTTFDGPGLCMVSPNIWYCYTASCTGDATVSLLGSSYDTMLAVYDGCKCELTTGDLIACNDDFGSSFQSQATFPVIAGNQYLIEVGGYSSETGLGILNIDCEPVLLPDKPDLGDAPDRTNNFGRTMHAYNSQGLLQFLVPANYPTVFNDGTGLGPYGPVHLNDLPVAFLGEMITHETEADLGIDEDGANNIRPAIDSADRDRGDDGVVFPINMPHCGWATIDCRVTVVDPDVNLWVNIWLDFNRDGDWDDTAECPAGVVHEWAVQNQYLFDLPAGLNQLTSKPFLSSHQGQGPKEIWMRITLSEQPWTGGSNPGGLGNGGSGPVANYEIGETEDYFFVPDMIDDTECPLCVDFNGDGLIDLDDLAAITAEWLVNCP